MNMRINPKANPESKVAVGAPLAIEVKNLSKRYAASKSYAVQDVTFSCRKGEVVGVLGSNGAGKSTTLKCLCGVLSFDEGEVAVAGHDILSDAVRAKRAVGFVGDSHYLPEVMTGTEFLSFMADMYGVSDEARSAAFDRLVPVFGLGGVVNDQICSYSHGTRQKLCMVGSLIHSPEVWILDEPTVGLDPSSLRITENLMRDFASGGGCVLFSTHNTDAVERVCDRAVVLHDGTCAAQMDLRTEEGREAFGRYVESITSGGGRQ